MHSRIVERGRYDFVERANLDAVGCDFLNVFRQVRCIVRRSNRRLGKLFVVATDVHEAGLECPGHLILLCMDEMQHAEEHLVHFNCFEEVCVLENVEHDAQFPASIP